MSDNVDCIIIGNSDYDRKELEDGRCGWGTTSNDFLETITEYESLGFEVRFETSFFRKIFGVTKYKVVGYKMYTPIRVRR